MGEVLSVSMSILELRLISEDSEWLDVELFELSEISCFGFGTSYEVELLNNVRQNKL
jgi:hypothetical protein